MRVLIFDWEEGGHHEVYVERFARALGARAEVVAAAPSVVLETLDDSLAVERVDLGPSRPEKGSLRTRPGLDRREMALFEQAIRSSGATHALHLFADHLLPAFAVRGRFDVPVSLLLLRPRAHYARFAPALTGRERAMGAIYELLLSRFRRRPDAHSVFTLDPVAAAAWASRPGAPARWMPEPWIEPGPLQEGPRDGCVLYGYLSARKGIERLARAVEFVRPGTRVVLAGVAAPDYEEELAGLCAAMSRSGARVERVGEIDESEAQRILGQARVAVLPYLRHVGMSRVLIEAACAGTPVLADHFGLVGHLAGEWGLGHSVDTDDPRAFAAALDAATGDAAHPDGAELRRTAEALCGPAEFERALDALLAEGGTVNAVGAAGPASTRA